jgi:hypothetical protein
MLQHKYENSWLLNNNNISKPNKNKTFIKI